MSFDRALSGLRRFAFALLILVFPAINVASAGPPTVAAGGFAPLHKPVGSRIHLVSIGNGAIPTDAECRANYGVPCYSPQELQHAYDVTPLLQAGKDGTGQTIVIIDSFGSPTIQTDLHLFDQVYNLPDPPSFRVIAPLGTVPFDPNNGDMVNWAYEATLDVEWSHAIAPGASIVLLTSPVSETEGVQGMPQFLALGQYAIDHKLGKIVSQSFGATEETLRSSEGKAIVASFNSVYQEGGRHGITYFASAGDSGTANVNQANQEYPYPTVIFPAASPYVTAVGGTSLYADTSGNRQSETVWNDNVTHGLDAATGGGVSRQEAEPNYQHALPASIQRLLDGHRGLPDIAYDADPFTGFPLVEGFSSGREQWICCIGGTSAGSPQWSGLIAIADQIAGHPLGFINPALYRLGKSSNYAEGLHDITVGDNANDGIPGYTAASGFDLTTGWGTPDAANLVPMLAGQPVVSDLTNP